MILKFSRHIFEKYSSIKFHENLSSGSQTVPCGRKEGQTEKYDKAKSRFSQFGEGA